MTSYANASSETSKDNTKRNKKTQAKKTQTWSALLSATALGVFLEGCGGGDTPASPPTTPPITPPAPVLGIESNPFVATAGNDVFTGSEGAAWVSYANSASGVEVDLSSNPAVVGEGATGDKLTSIQNIIGSATKVNDLSGNGEDNVFRGGVVEDTLQGYDGDDTLYGGAGNDRISGGTQHDTLFGGAGGETTLLGEAGKDTITGGAGNDRISGGTQHDTYIFHVGDGTDVIIDRVEETMTLRFEGSQYVAADFTEASAHRDG